MNETEIELAGVKYEAVIGASCKECDVKKCGAVPCLPWERTDHKVVAWKRVRIARRADVVKMAQAR